MAIRILTWEGVGIGNYYLNWIPYAILAKDVENILKSKCFTRTCKKHFEYKDFSTSLNSRALTDPLYYLYEGVKV